MARLTADQSSAVFARDPNILVSAGAGSGKTTVLSERVLSLLKEGIDVDRLVVLTFTNAAAAEMKARIRQKIREAGMIEQEKRLDNAIVSTFDSFAQRIVSEHRHLLRDSSSGGIADPVLVQLEQNTLIQRVLEETYEQGDPGFLEEAALLFHKGDFVLVQGIRTLASGLDRMPDRLEALERFQAENDSKTRVDSILDGYLRLLAERAASLPKAAKALLELAIILPKIERYGDCVRQMIQAAKDASCFEDHLEAARMSLQKAPSFSSEDNDKPAFQEANQAFKSAWEDYRKSIRSVACNGTEELRDSLCEQQRRIAWIYRMTHRFMTAWNDRKREKNLLSFHDVFDDALWLLRHGEGVAARYRETIEEILIDEYQDNNDLQEAFLDALGCKRRFFVGDVKQSIYGFRDANPANFMAKAEQYARNEGGRLIPLTANFRSRPEVLRDINRLFERLMDKSVGGVDYANNQALVFGNAAYLEEPTRENATFGLSFVGYPPIPDETGRSTEARQIARHIAHQLAHASTHDWDNGGIRPLRYRDIAIIVDRKSAFTTYREHLMQEGIPVRILSDETFVAADEIQTAANLLRLIRLYGKTTFSEDEFRRAFYGVCRSYVVQIEDCHVLDLFVRHSFRGRDDLKALIDHAQFGSLDKTMRELADWSTRVSIDRLYEETAHRFDLLGMAHRLENPAAAEAKLLYLHTKLASLHAFDLDQAIAYFEAVESSDDLDVDYQTTHDDASDAVTILTMHKSKGLEFPVCYFPGLDRKFHLPEAKEFFQFDPVLGLFSKAHRHGFHDTPMHVLLQAKRLASDRSERMRLLYVALTRVKESGYLLLNQTLLDKIDPKPMLRDVKERRSALRFSDWTTHFAGTLLPIHRTPEASPIRPIGQPSITSNAMPFSFRKVSPTPRVVLERTYSAKTHLSESKDDTAMSYGETLHERLSSIDWSDIAWDQLNESERTILKRLIRNPVLGLPEAKHFREVALLDEHDRLAVVDLIVETQDELRVVDYKTKDIDHAEYVTQVANYCALLRTRTNKPVKGYLISLMTGETKPVEEPHDSIVPQP